MGVIMDKVVDAQKKGQEYSMHIEGRIVHDPSSVKSKLNILENDLETDELNGAMTEIATTLLQVMRSEFSLKRTTDEVKIINLRIKNKGDVEQMFELNAEDSTMKNICCWRCISVKTNLKPMEFPDYNDKNVVGYSVDKEDGDANERNGIYVADDTQTIPTQPIKSDTSCTQLPMVSIHEDHPNKR